MIATIQKLLMFREPEFFKYDMDTFNSSNPETLSSSMTDMHNRDWYDETKDFDLEGMLNVFKKPHIDEIDVADLRIRLDCSSSHKPLYEARRDDVIYWIDGTYAMHLCKKENGDYSPIAVLSFDAAENGILIKQFQGMADIDNNTFVRDTLSQFYYSNALLAFATDWAIENGLDFVFVQPKDKALFAERFGNHGYRSYDINALSMGFSEYPTADLGEEKRFSDVSIFKKVDYYFMDVREMELDKELEEVGLTVPSFEKEKMYVTHPVIFKK